MRTEFWTSESFIDARTQFSFKKMRMYNCLKPSCISRFHTRARAMNHNCQSNTKLACKSEIMLGMPIKNWLDDHNFAYYENAHFCCYDIEAVNSKVTQDNQVFTGNQHVIYYICTFNFQHKK